MARKKKKGVKYIRVSENAKIERFQELSKRVRDGELERAYYAIDGNVGYHYYKVLNK